MDNSKTRVKMSNVFEVMSIAIFATVLLFLFVNGIVMVFVSDYVPMYTEKTRLLLVGVAVSGFYGCRIVSVALKYRARQRQTDYGTPTVSYQ
ncbi:MAG TPA: hypothetical protein DCL49_07355 [Candidatus Omnitrophica bacterium]|nr:hypothetical protein [Candidatus Omnitrophota bacterium]